MSGRFNTVYFMRQIGTSGPVKIGVTSYLPSRLNTLAAWSPVMLEVAAHMPGSLALERRLHQRFERDALHHEWFAWSPELEAVIEQVAAGAFDPETLPPVRKRRRGYGWTAGQKYNASVFSRMRRLQRRGLAWHDALNAIRAGVPYDLSSADDERVAIAKAHIEPLFDRWQDEFPTKRRVAA